MALVWPVASTVCCRMVTGTCISLYTMQPDITAAENCLSCRSSTSMLSLVCVVLESRRSPVFSLVYSVR